MTTGSLLSCRPFFGGTNLWLCSWSFEGSNIIAVYPLPVSHQSSNSQSSDLPEAVIQISVYAFIPEILGLATLIFEHPTIQCEPSTNIDIDDSPEMPGHIPARLLTFTILIQNGPMSLKFGIMTLYLPHILPSNTTFQPTDPPDNRPLSEITKCRATLVLGSPLIEHSMGRSSVYHVVGKTLFATNSYGDPIPEDIYLTEFPLWIHRLKVPHLLEQAELARDTEVEASQLSQYLHPSGNLWTRLQPFIGSRKVILDFAFDEHDGRLYVLTCGRPGFQVHVADYV